MRRFLVFLIVAGATGVLTGCHTDSGSRASSPIDSDSTPIQGRSETPAAPLPDSRPVLACFGDSLTAGYGADEGQSYPDYLQKDLDEAGYHYRVVNEGISGNTTKDGVDRLSEVLALHPAVVVLEFGGNDGLRGLKTQTTKANLARMIVALKGSGAKVLLAGITLPPDYGPDYVTAFTANYPTLAKRYDVPVMPFILKDVYGVAGMMQADNIHATDQGNAIVAKSLLPYVEPLLKK
jgi:acyl-CoA thioesterase-1